MLLEYEVWLYVMLVTIVSLMHGLYAYNNCHEKCYHHTFTLYRVLQLKVKF